MKSVDAEAIERIIEDAHDALKAEGCTNVITMFVKDDEPQFVVDGLTMHHAYGYAGWLRASSDYLETKNMMLNDGTLKAAKKRAIDEAVDAEIARREAEAKESECGGDGQ